MVGRTCLLIFTKWPEPGFAKTRLIKALGAAGAAQVSRRLTEHCLAGARAFQRTCVDTTIRVHFAGSASSSEMGNWLGADGRVEYIEQVAGDLGCRLNAAFDQAFTDGFEKVIVVGTDAPDVGHDVLSNAATLLNRLEAVIGPAKDGGYYLLGLTTRTPSIFQGIEWSTEVVLQQTLGKLTEANLRYQQLETLSDVDNPEDLVVWERVKSRSQLHAPAQH